MFYASWAKWLNLHEAINTYLARYNCEREADMHAELSTAPLPRVQYT